MAVSFFCFFPSVIILPGQPPAEVGASDSRKGDNPLFYTLNYDIQGVSVSAIKVAFFKTPKATI